MTAPLIGITCEFDEYIRPTGRERSYSKLYHDYYHAIRRAGGRAVLLPVHQEPEMVLDLLPVLAGVMLTGADDYPSAFYGEPLHPKARTSSPWRAEQDLMLCRNLLERSSLPVLAICGGMQILSIADGGALTQDIPSQVGERITHRGATHDIKVESGSRLHSLAGERAHVNSWHHQCVKRFGARLKPVAWADDGVTEAAELKKPDGRFLLAVQWHPERMADDATAIKIFADFVLACGK